MAQYNGNKGIYEDNGEEVSFELAMEGINKKDLLHTDKRHFQVTVYDRNNDVAAHQSLAVWQPSTVVDEDRPNPDEESTSDDNKWIFALGDYGSNQNKFNLSIEFSTTNGSEIRDGSSKQKDYTLSANIGVSPNFTIEGSTEVAIGSSLGSAAINWAVGMTRTHAPGVQNFKVGWHVTELYYGARSNITIQPNVSKSQADYNEQTAVFTRVIRVHDADYYVKIYLDVDKK